MKKHFFFTPLLAVLMAMTTISCQKEESIVTLGAKIQKPVSGNAKVYIDDHTPCWHNGDEVYINNAAYPIMAASGSSARIENVVSSNTYRAIFPASIVTEGSNIGSNASFPVTLPSTQTYQVLDGVQRVDVPMGAYLTSGSTLQFQNLCSVVRVTVSNSLTTALSLQSIVIDAENAYLSGAGTATVSGSSSDGITISSNSSHSVSLAFPTYNPVMVGALRSADFDIIVPTFTTDNVTITINTTDGHYFSLPKRKALDQNTITTVCINVTELIEAPHAELVDGSSFRAAIPLTATVIVFEYNSSISSGTILSTSDSPVPIYGNLDGTVWKITTSAPIINANPDCSDMFFLMNNLESIDFGIGFNTSNVTGMAGMFAHCNKLTNLDVSNFNTSNVTDMHNMFYGCHVLTSLDVSNFNTSNVMDMKNMFGGCISLTRLNVSNFITSNVTDMSYMFQGCSNLTTINVENFNTSNVTDMHGMFRLCQGLVNISGTGFNTTNVTDMSQMFEGCSNLTYLSLSSFNTSNVTDMQAMFMNCSSLTTLDLSTFDMSHLTTQYYDGQNRIGKYNMCSGLSTFSHYCTITCSETVQNELESGTGLPTSGVTFTWVRP